MGCRRDLAAFEQQLMYAISLECSRVEPSGPYRPMEKTEVKVGEVGEQKKYCLDFNKGLCKLQGPHEGLLNDSSVVKYHICKKCLIDDRLEKAHPMKDCIKK